MSPHTTYAHTHIYTCMRTHTRVHTLHTDTHVHIHMYTHARVHTHTHIHTHTYTHIHTHTQIMEYYCLGRLQFDYEAVAKIEHSDRGQPSRTYGNVKCHNISFLLQFQ